MSDGSTNPDTGSTADRLAQRVTSLSDTVTRLTKASEDSATRGRISAYGQQLSSTIAAAETAITTAERALATAVDDGDGTVIASKQRALAEAVATKSTADRKMDEHRTAVRQYDAEQAAEAQKPAEPAPAAASAEAQTAETTLDYKNVNEWKNKNKDWYGVDEAMTAAAKDIDTSIQKAGVISVGSTAYFEAVDRQMAKRFPDKFTRTAEGAAPGGGTAPTTVGHGRISSHNIATWKRMGIDTDDPKVMERMVKHRERAVSKNQLPQEPINAPVLS